MTFRPALLLGIVCLLVSAAPRPAAGQFLADTFRRGMFESDYEVYGFEKNGDFRLSRSYDQVLYRGRGTYSISGDSLFLSFDYVPPDRVASSGVMPTAYTVHMESLLHYESPGPVRFEITRVGTVRKLKNVTIELLENRDAEPLIVVDSLNSPIFLDPGAVDQTHLLRVQAPGYQEEYVTIPPRGRFSVNVDTRLVPIDSTVIRIDPHQEAYRFDFDPVENALTLFTDDGPLVYSAKR